MTFTPKSQRKLIVRLLEEGYVTPAAFRKIHPWGRSVFTHYEYLKRVKSYANDSANRDFHLKLLSIAHQYNLDF